GRTMMSSVNRQSSKLLKLIIHALLVTISIVLLFLNFPLPFLLLYLKIVFIEVTALMAILIFSQLAGAIVTAIKNLLYLSIEVVDLIGVIANFLAGLMFVLPVSIFYHKFKGVKSVVSGLVTGTFIMAFGMSVLNYFIILPAYSWFMGWEMTSHVKWVS